MAFIQCLSEHTFDGHRATLEKLSADWEMSMMELVAKAARDQHSIEQRAAETLTTGGGSALRGVTRVSLSLAVMALLSKAPALSAAADDTLAAAPKAPAPELLDLYTGGCRELRAMSRVEMAMLVLKAGAPADAMARDAFQSSGCVVAW